MDYQSLVNEIKIHLEKLCHDIENRHVGSSGNLEASRYVESVFVKNGLDVEKQVFDCIEWSYGEVRLEAEGRSFESHVSPYSLPFKSKGQFVSASSLEELEDQNYTGKILLIHGELAKEQIMAKGFVFYNPDSHKKIVSILEEKKPVAIICATGKNPDLAGSMYPFPMFEDGDFDIPSVYMKDIDGEKLKKFTGKEIYLEFDSKRIPSKGSNVLGRLGDFNNGKIVVTAHLDTKKGTPGALDNGTGIATLLALSNALKNYKRSPGIELAVLNGEDYYACSGEMLYLEELDNDFSDMKLLINIDGAGHKDGNIAFSTHLCSEKILSNLGKVINSDHNLEMGEIWYQGDHMIFVQNGVPAIAITSSNFTWLCQEVTHTPEDSLEKVDYEKVASAVMAIKNLVQNI